MWHNCLHSTDDETYEMGDKLLIKSNKQGNSMLISPKNIALNLSEVVVHKTGSESCGTGLLCEVLESEMHQKHIRFIPYLSPRKGQF